MRKFTITDTTDGTTRTVAGIKGLEKGLTGMFEDHLDEYQGQDDDGIIYLTSDIIHNIVLGRADGDDTTDLEVALDISITETI